MHCKCIWLGVQWNHRLAAMVYRIENFVWGDARAQHTCLILMTEDGRILMIEIRYWRCQTWNSKINEINDSTIRKSTRCIFSN